MTRNIFIPDYIDFYKVLKQVLNNYSISIGATTNQHFADVLHIKGDNKSSAFSNLINVGTGKYLKTNELLLLLDNTPEHQKPVLDYICNRYGFTCNESAKRLNTNNDNLKDMLLNITANDGALISDFQISIQDEELTIEEIDRQLEIF